MTIKYVVSYIIIYISLIREVEYQMHKIEIKRKEAYQMYVLKITEESSGDGGYGNAVVTYICMIMD